MTRTLYSAVLWLVLPLAAWPAGRMEAAEHQETEKQVTGLVVSVDPAHQTLVVSHDAIPGYMPAMTMPYRVRERETLDAVKPGMTIQFTLIVTDHESFITDVRIRRYESLEPDPAQSRRLAILDEAMGKKSGAAAVLAAGDAVPDFELTDQRNRAVALSQFSGKVAVITFIYTRCPLPDYCMRLTNNFGEMQKRFRERLGKDMILVSITFDPEHDRPEVLAKYADSWKAESVGWYFLTGSLPAIRRVCGMFGMNFWPEEGLMTHSLHTIVVDRNRKLVANIEGNQFTAKQLGDLVEATLEQPQAGKVDKALQKPSF